MSQALAMPSSKPSDGEGRLKACIASWAPFLGGAEVAAERLALGLKAAGHDVFVILGTPGEAENRMRQAGLRCYVAPMHMTDRRRFWRYLIARRRLTKILARERPDIVHCNDLPTGQMIGESAKRLGIPRLCHHRFIFENVAVDWLNKFGAERHVFVSKALMEELIAQSRTLTRVECKTVHDGLPLPPVPTSEDRIAARKAKGLPLDKTLALIAGQVIERKGIADLLHAWSRLSPEASQRAELLVVGDDVKENGRYRAAMEKLAGELGISARFVGFQSDVPLWLQAADFAVVPSHVEPLGNATLEAMAHALPVIGADVGGIPEMVCEGETGLLVPPKAPDKLAVAVETLILDEPLRRRLGKGGRERCEREFSLERHAENMVAEFRKTIGSAAARSA